MISNQVTSKSQTGSIRKARLYTWRAVRWRCPVCGNSPLFLPLQKVEGITDWFDMFHGCPRCGCDYHREPGYYLLALGIINASIVAVLGVVEVLLLASLFDISAALLMFITLVTMWGVGILSARHAKALYLAFDHFIHPHEDKPG